MSRVLVYPERLIYPFSRRLRKYKPNAVSIADHLAHRRGQISFDFLFRNPDATLSPKLIGSVINLVWSTPLVTPRWIRPDRMAPFDTRHARQSKLGTSRMRGSACSSVSNIEKVAHDINESEPQCVVAFSRVAV